jgi:excisionase family DNA binding protein
MSSKPITLSPEEVADILNCFDARWVTNKCREGEIRSFKLGGRWRIPPTAVVEYLEASPNFSDVEGEFKSAINHLKSLG